MARQSPEVVFTAALCPAEIRSGLAVLLVSSELDEVLSLADRVAVIYRGRLVGILEGQAVERERIGLMMAGAA